MSVFTLVFKGIWFCAFASSFIHFVIGFVPYYLSAKMYFGLYFFMFIIAVIANHVSNLGPLWAVKWRINLLSTSTEMWFFFFVAFSFFSSYYCTIFVCVVVCESISVYDNYFHQLFDDFVILIYLILVILMLVVFERISRVLCNVEPFSSANISVFYHKVPINQLFVCTCFEYRFS